MASSHTVSHTATFVPLWRHCITVAVCRIDPKQIRRNAFWPVWLEFMVFMNLNELKCTCSVYKKNFASRYLFVTVSPLDGNKYLCTYFRLWFFLIKQLLLGRRLVVLCFFCDNRMWPNGDCHWQRAVVALGTVSTSISLRHTHNTVCVISVWPVRKTRTYSHGAPFIHFGETIDCVRDPIVAIALDYI